MSEEEGDGYDIEPRSRRLGASESVDKNVKCSVVVQSSDERCRVERVLNLLLVSTSFDLDPPNVYEYSGRLARTLIALLKRSYLMLVPML